MQLRQHCSKLCKFAALNLIFHQNESLVCSLCTKQTVFIILDRTDNKIQTTVFHVHPSHVRSKIIISLESLLSLLKILFQTRIFCKANRLIQQLTNLVYLFLILFSVPLYHKFSALISSQNSVKTTLVLVFQSIKLLLGHVFRIKIGTKRLFTKTIHKRLHVVQPFPRTIVNHCKLFGELVRYGIHVCLVTIGLQPIQIVHYLGDVEENPHQFLLFCTQLVKIGTQSDSCKFFNFRLHF